MDQTLGCLQKVHFSDLPTQGVESKEFEWEEELAHALISARELCIANRGRAPWGCKWFEEWRRNLDLAVMHKQRLHVFYFENNVAFSVCFAHAFRESCHTSAGAQDEDSPKATQLFDLLRLGKARCSGISFVAIMRGLRHDE